MLKLYLARHGQNEDNANGILNGHRDFPLTALGRGQAQELATGIQSSGISFDVVYSSPLSRAYETAKTVTDTLGLPEPVVVQNLIERDFGVMTGKPVKDIESLCGPDILKTDTITYFLSPERAETFPVLLERASCALRDIVKMHPNGTVLVVTHGDFGKMLYAAYYHLDWKDILIKFHFGNSELLLLSEDSLADESHVIRIEQYNH